MLHHKDQKWASPSAYNRRNSSTRQPRRRLRETLAHKVSDLAVKLRKVLTSPNTCQSLVWRSDNWHSLPASQPNFLFPDDISTSCLRCSWWGPVCQVVSTARSPWRCSLSRSLVELLIWELRFCASLASLVLVWLRLYQPWKIHNQWRYSSIPESSLLH